jgi:hypothetical protein
MPRAKPTSALTPSHAPAPSKRKRAPAAQSGTKPSRAKARPASDAVFLPRSDAAIGRHIPAYVPQNPATWNSRSRRSDLSTVLRHELVRAALTHAVRAAASVATNYDNDDDDDNVLFARADPPELLATLRLFELAPSFTRTLVRGQATRAIPLLLAMASIDMPASAPAHPPYPTYPYEARAREAASFLAARGPPEPHFAACIMPALRLVRKQGLATTVTAPAALLAHLTPFLAPIAAPPNDYIVPRFAQFPRARAWLGWIPPAPPLPPTLPPLLPPDPDGVAHDAANADARKRFLADVLGATATAATAASTDHCRTCHSNAHLTRHMLQTRATDEMLKVLFECKSPACLAFRAKSDWGPGERHAALRALRASGSTAI